MKSFIKILRYVFPKYQKNAYLYTIYTILSVVFGLFSISLVAQFLGVLFEKHEMILQPVEFGLSVDAIKAFINYKLSAIILQYNASAGLLFVCILVVLSTLFKTFFHYAGKYVMAPLRMGVIRDVRNSLYIKVLELSLSFYSDERKGDIISRMTNDVNEIETSIIRSIDVFFKNPLSIIITLSYLIYLSPSLTLFVFVLLPFTFGIIGKIGSTLRKTSSIAQGKLGDLLSLIEETLSGLRIIKAFNANQKMNNLFDSENQEYTNVMVRMWRRRDLANPMSEFLGTVVMVVILWFGGRLVLNDMGGLNSEELITFLLIFYTIISPVKAIADALYNVQKGLASSDRIDMVLNAEVSIFDKASALTVDTFNNKIQYKNIFFKYKDAFVIKGIDLEINKGQTIALVGQSGSGKSTLVDLLPRFYDLTKGAIEIDGTDIRDMKIKSLRKLMGIVNQESILFNDSIFNNIAFGVESATLDEVIAAAKIANAHDFILETPNGYETNIGDRGGNLSGGQRQRISIARAILANPPIMILDEATSALDTESEKLVQESLTRLMENRTSIVIAHRLSTVVHADVICVVHEGEIVEKGTHQELIKLDGQYKKLHDIQMFA
ncbi:MAG: ABC transporter ATP-binding protein [Salinivirgaceae bacterium]|nr:ABC transporter ATP-binding protein [Salinivirgaceae bacterium]